jgi:DNA-binding Xre family transcriptional regulator
MKIKIKDVAYQHGIWSAYRLQCALECSPTMASRLWKEEFKQIGIGTLEKLCALFSCQPNDILEYQPSQVPQPAPAEQMDDIQPTKYGDIQLSRTYDFGEVAQFIGRSRRSVRGYMDRGRLTSNGRYGEREVKGSELLEFVNSYWFRHLT